MTHSGMDRPTGKRPWSVRTYLFGIAGTAMVLVGLFGSYVAFDRFQGSRTDALERNEREAARRALAISDSISEGVLNVGQTAVAPELAAAFVKPEGCGLTSSTSGVFSAVELSLIDPAGRVVCSSQPENVSMENPVYAELAWLKEVRAVEGPLVSDTFIDPFTDSKAVAVAAPVFDGDHNFVGTFAMVAAWEGVAADLAAGSPGTAGLDFIVVDPGAGLILSSSGPLRDRSDALRGTGFQDAASGEIVGLDGEPRLYSSKEVPDLGLQVFVGQTTDAVMAAARSAMWRSILFLLLILSLLTLVTLLANRKIAVPLRRLSDAIGAARGELLPAEIAIDGPAEVVDVAHEYNEMLRARADYEERLMYQALHDSLTDLPNRQLALDRIGQALQREGRAEELAILVLDLDRFKVLNDSLGHDLGDRVLVEVVHRLRDAVRPQDTIARFGGDEFVVICDELDGGYQAVGVAEDIQRALRPSFTTSMGPAVLTASIGISFNQGGSDRPEDLFRDANAAMHRAKDQGRARYEVFDSDLGDRVNDRLRIENDLRRAIEDRSLTVHYQPKVDLRHGRIVGAEALVRWNHPVRGWLSPLQFIGIAEDSGLIVPLGDFVLDEATLQVNRWADLSNEPIHVAVNLSGRQLTQPDFPNTVTRILESNRVSPTQVCLEVTEAVLLDEESPVGEVLNRFSAMGFTMSLDDFGTGYSSLAYLRRFPFEELKIDRAFVQDLDISAGEGTLIEAILGMAKALHLHVVAEGIESQDQLSKLLRLGCDTGQGFFLARPQPAESFESLLVTGVTAGPAEDAGI